MTKIILITKDNFLKLRSNFRWREANLEYCYTEINGLLKLEITSFYIGNILEKLLNKYDETK